MWICPICNHSFLRDHQTHSCLDKTLDDYLRGKSEITIGLYYHFISEYRNIGAFEIRPTKTQIALSSKVRFAAIHRLGKNFLDVVFHFDRSFDDNLCFHKIANIPGTESYNHYVRLFSTEDLNDEVKDFMRMALQLGNREELTGKKVKE